MDFLQDLAPVVADFLGMQANHRIEEVGMLTTELKDIFRRIQVDGGHENLLHASFAGALEHVGKVVAKFFAIDMGMSVDHG